MATSSFSNKLFSFLFVLCIAAFAAARSGDFEDELYTVGVTETNAFASKSFESEYASESFASESGELVSDASKSDPFVSDNTEFVTESVAVTEPLVSAETASPSDSEAATSTDPNPDPTFTPVDTTPVRTNITVSGDVSTFKPDQFEIDLALALGVKSDQINVLTVTPGSVVAYTEITYAPGGPSPQAILNDLIDKVTNGDPSLAALGIESVTNSDGSVVPIGDGGSDDDDSSDGGSDNTGAIVGGVIGGVAGVALIAGASFYYVKNKGKGTSGTTEMSQPNYSQV